jgi:hypothetical protein
MPLKYVETKDQLPIDSDYECPICLNDINLDEVVDGVPNCVICHNGHRVHNNCFRQSTKHECPVCKTDDLRFCKSIFGYSYVERNGGTKSTRIRNPQKKTRKWSRKYKKSINCKRPKGFSQKQYCKYGRK